MQEQDADHDADPLTSEGIFVAATDTSVVGDLVRVRGTAAEGPGTPAGNSMTRLASVTGMVLCSSGNPLPTTTVVQLPAPSPTNAPAAYEPLEGMHVRLPQSLVISEYFNYGRFGEIVLGLPLPGESRHFTPTSVVEPGLPAQQRFAEYLVRRITLDDGLGVQNPEFTRHPNGAGFSLTNTFRGGDTVADTTGVMSWDFNLWRIQPTAAAEYTSVNPRPGPIEAPDGVHVAAMNTLNFFTTLDIEPNSPPHPDDNKCGPLQNVECRGADSNQPAEFDRQRTKLLAALSGLEADVIGLNELENTTGVDPLSDPDGIVPGLNALLGPGTYDAIDTGTIGTDAIKVGLIYKPGVVTPVGDFEVLTTADDARFRDNLNRPVLAQTFQVNETGARFTVAVNHLKSKGSDCNAVGDPDTGDGQGNCNQTRKLAAQALVDWLASDPTGSGDPDFLIVGDLNSYAKEDPIDAVLAGPDDVLGTGDDYTNLIELYEGEHAYSFVFDGMAGYLDHGLASATLAAQVVGAAEWHINADEANLLDYDTSFKPPAQEAIFEENEFRSADHDPLVVTLDACDDVDPTLSLSVSPNALWPPNHKYVTVQADVDFDDNFDTSPTLELVSVTSNEPDNGEDDGNTVERHRRRRPGHVPAPRRAQRVRQRSRLHDHLHRHGRLRELDDGLGDGHGAAREVGLHGRGGGQDRIASTSAAVGSDGCAPNREAASAPAAQARSSASAGSRPSRSDTSRQAVNASPAPVPSTTSTSGGDARAISSPSSSRYAPSAPSVTAT